MKVRGNVQVDRFSGELTMLADDLMVGRRPAREDTYEGPLKRVELHAHTTMSAMDGMIDPAELVKTAVKWGHKAVAITDHGVVQAFPAASNVKVPEDFRVIYGCELFLVDDGAAVIQRPPEGVPLGDAEFVVLDIETTGFSPIGDDIIELGAVRFRGGEVLDTFQSFVRPTKPVPPEVQKLTNITPDMLEGAPEPEEALARVLRLRGRRHRRGAQRAVRLLVPALPPAEVPGRGVRQPGARHADAGPARCCPTCGATAWRRSPRSCRCPLVDHHRADADAKTAAMVLVKLLERARRHRHRRRPEQPEPGHQRRAAPAPPRDLSW